MSFTFGHRGSSPVRKNVLPESAILNNATWHYKPSGLPGSWGWGDGKKWKDDKGNVDLLEGAGIGENELRIIRNGLNSHKIIEVHDVDLQASGSQNVNGALASGVVFKPVDGYGGLLHLGGGGTTDYYYGIKMQSSKELGLEDDNGRNADIATNALTYGIWKMLIASFASGTLTLYIDNLATSYSASTNAIGTSLTTSQNRKNPTINQHVDTSKIQYAEAFMYEGVITDFDIQDTFAHWRSKYNL